MEYLIWLGLRLRPRPGWLPFILLLTILGTLVGAVMSARWIPEIGLIAMLVIVALILTVVLALRPLKAVWAWALLLAYGLILTFIEVGQLRPPLTLLFKGSEATGDFIQRQTLLLLVRISSWSEAVAAGKTSRETVVFALIVSFLAWMLTCYAAWMTFRQYQPLPGLTPIGVALAVNHYFSDIEIWPVLIFIPLTALLAAAIHFYTLETDWERRGVDFSTEIKMDLLFKATLIAVFLLPFSWVVPSLRPSVLAEVFQHSSVIQEAEAVAERAFAGVRQSPRDDEAALVADLGDGEVSQGLPRALLMGNPPELFTTLVMTATVQMTVIAENADVAGGKWRGLSYDVYTGRGWSVSQWDNTSTVPADTPILSPDPSANVVTQSVYWLLDERQTRYMLGHPVNVNQPVVVTWHGENDPARLQGEGWHYEIVTVLPAAAPENLRQSNAAAIPASIQEQYTVLPDSLPLRVRQLARQVTNEAPTAYDQAIALEKFLRQYPYTLNVEPPPTRTDLVDYFLFDLQKGYCDYFASAMVVMARSLDIPARLVVGYAAATPDDNGVQTIMQANAHSWPELYFGGVGWVSFEPTAAYPVWGPTVRPEENAAAPPDFTALPAVALPARQPAFAFPWLAILGLIAVIGVWLEWWCRQAKLLQEDGILWAYGRLQRRARQIDQPLRIGETPYEFAAALSNTLRAFPVRWQTPIWQPLSQLIEAYVLHRYSTTKTIAPATGFTLWHQLARPLWLISLWHRLRKTVKSQR